MLILFIVLFCILKNKKGKDNISQAKPIIVTPEPNEYKIKNEFNILTKTGDLKRIQKKEMIPKISITFHLK